jgi:hypothetical protein
MDDASFATWGQDSVRLSQEEVALFDMQDVEQHRVIGTAIRPTATLGQKVSLLDHDVCATCFGGMGRRCGHHFRLNIESKHGSRY